MKKGFTLIELLAVIIILLIILSIAIPPLMNVLTSSKSKAYGVTVNSIENAAKLYVAANPELFTDDDYFELSLEDLCNESYLTCPVYNPDNEEEMNGYVVIERFNNTFEYTYVED